MVVSPVLANWDYGGEVVVRLRLSFVVTGPD